MKFTSAFKKIAIPLFFLLIFSSIADQWISFKLENELHSPHGASGALWLYVILSLVVSVAMPVLASCLCLWAFKNSFERPISIEQFHDKYIEQIFIEQIRGWGKSMQWSLLFILPGIIKFFEFILVPFVVACSPSYDKGEKDALELSAQIVKKNIWKITGIIFLFNTLIPLIITAVADDYQTLWSTPVPALALIFLDTLILYTSTYLLYKVFIKHEGVLHESYV